ncbi:MAG: acetyl-CoA carboxylase biotin carboxylase subunit [Defluviitaleaceae bacterium]|nr:acetyl-CoA carboxylase biotin carboxylase subunit [Defluviitaleaceae bacterium]
MFDKILIANRGEIAVRVIRAAREMGIQTVAVYSEADRDALHSQLADEAVCIGPAKPADSYLNMQNIISAAVLTQSKAIHPGFGFLSENSVFASMCEECGIKFIGPSAETIDLLGNKIHAKELMRKSGVPVVPGTRAEADPISAKAEAAKIGYPVMLKAAAGGGGRGIRIARSEDEIGALAEAVKKEGELFFGDGSFYVEKYIENPRHIEVQVLGDEYGNIIHLGERNCSIQRRHQKMLEETPCLTPKLRAKLGDVAVSAAKAANYKNAGTVEFLMDKNDDFYFMEMNTRIQVEHPITEMVTGIDLVKRQILIANGEKNLSQKDVKLSGHAIECRINAESPEKNFAPSCGEITFLLLPSGGMGLRVDSAIYQGLRITPHYDSMLAKVVAHGETREDAIMKMRRALYEFVIEGVETNIDYQMRILGSDEFLSGKYDTGFLGRMG